MARRSRNLHISGLSGNEIYCLSFLGYVPGEIIVGNSVFAIGVLGSATATLRGLAGGEIVEYTNVISEGRRLALERLANELEANGAQGATGVSSELIFHAGNIEFLSVGTGLHASSGTRFTTAETGQDLFCQLDAHYQPLKFVFGNVAYSIGLRGRLIGSFKTLGRGEVKEFSEIFSATRKRALERISAEAQTAGGNAVVGIRTAILPFASLGVHEMVMTGTASQNPYIPGHPSGGIVTSDLTADEMWSAARLGMAPLQLLLSTSVYSLGVLGGLKSAWRSFVRGEIPELTTLIYEARESAIDALRRQAEEIGADRVIGARTYIYQLGGGLIEFLVLGTAVKEVGEAIRPRSESLPLQAVLRDRESFTNSAQTDRVVNLLKPDR